MLHSPATPMDLPQAFAYCERLAKSRQENFTVVSWFLPKRFRPSLYAVYAYCRLTDDMGDEAQGERLALLAAWEADLRRCYGGAPEHPVLAALQSVIQKHAIPPEPFLDLIQANRMDQTASSYRTFEDLLAYCRRSANSVGRMVLHVFGYGDLERQRLADATCTALQLANFWQDIRRDLEKDRVYIPLEDMKRFGYTEEMLQDGISNDQFRRLMAFEVARTRQFFREGQPLLDMVDPSLRLDLRLFTAGGLAVLRAIDSERYDVLKRRPSVGRAAKARLTVAAFSGLVWQRLRRDAS